MRSIRIHLAIATALLLASTGCGEKAPPPSGEQSVNQKLPAAVAERKPASPPADPPAPKTVEKEEAVRSDVAIDIRKVLDQALAAINNKDLRRNMALMHPESPNYRATLAKTQMMLTKYDVTTEIIDYDYIGASGGYAFIQIEQKNTFNVGQFKGTTVELVHALKKHEGTWKFWSIMQVSMVVANRP